MTQIVIVVGKVLMFGGKYYLLESDIDIVCIYLFYVTTTE